MPDSTQYYVLNDWSALRASGSDATSFLQGQLSNDVKQLPVERAVPAGLHNPQGRVVALLWLRAAPDGVWIMLPRPLLTEVAKRLRRFVLRSKVAIDETSSSHVVCRRCPEGRDLRVVDDPAAHPEVHDAATWRRLEIADGIPEVLPSTSESFVAQMLNLDCIGAISWNKGCYTGQEVIARAHYRGRVKRRMQRFAFPGPAPVAGSTHRTSDGIDVQVVNSEAQPAGGCELLAVAPLDTRSRDSLPMAYALPE